MVRAFEGQGARKEGAHLASARPITAFVDRDAGNPDAKGTVRIIPAHCRKAGKEGFLCQIERLVGVADMLDDQSIDRRLVPAQQFAIGIVAPGAGIGCQILVATLRKAGVHRASAVSALTTLSSNIFAWPRSRTARMAKRCTSVSFCSVPITSCVWSMASVTRGP